MVDLKKYSKTITAVVGAVLILISAFAPGKYDSEIATVLAVLTALGVYAVPNEQQSS